jgi:hypothetical protein
LVGQEYNRGEVGVFADYFRLSQTNPMINFVGVGGRASFNVNSNTALEAEMNYDFKRNYTTFSNGVTTAFGTSLRPPRAIRAQVAGGRLLAVPGFPYGKGGTHQFQRLESASRVRLHQGGEWRDDWGHAVCSLAWRGCRGFLGTVWTPFGCG